VQVISNAPYGIDCADIEAVGPMQPEETKTVVLCRGSYAKSDPLQANITIVYTPKNDTIRHRIRGHILARVE
jgi:tRNA A37 threonylcarbamoyladenosine dehydratase